jgi:urea transport system substrate-binding protein
VLLAIGEINDDGGILGKQLEVIVEDGASEPGVFAEKARKLLETDEVAVIFGGWTSESRKAMLPVLEELNGLLFYPLPYEGFEQSPNIFYLGQDPSQQLIPAVNYLLEQGLVNLLLVGSEFSYSRTAHTIVKVQMNEAGHAILGELYIPLGGKDFSSLMEQLRASPPDAIINTMYGESNQAFFQQLAEAGFTALDIPIMSTSVAEEEVRVIGAEFLKGHFTTWNYFQTLQSPENFAFVTAYKDTYGQDRVTSAPLQNAYAAVYLWKALVETAESTAVDDVRAAANEELELIAPDGPVRIDSETQHLYNSARIGIIREDGLIDEVWHSETALAPDPFLTQYSWAGAVQDILDSFSAESK